MGLGVKPTLVDGALEEKRKENTSVGCGASQIAQIVWKGHPRIKQY